MNDIAPDKFHFSLLRWVLPICLQILPGCALTTPADHAGISHYSTSRHTSDVPSTYGHTADYVSFADDVEAGESGNSGDIVLAGTSTPLPPEPEFSDDDVWPVSLLEAVQLALNNSEVVPVDAQFLSSSSPLLNAPESVASIYDPAIQSTSVAGARGFLAATSDFVPVLTARSTYGEDDTIQNNSVSTGLPAGSLLEGDNGNLQISLAQQLATGANLQLQHNTTYNENNISSNLFPNVYEGQLAVEFNQPLWAGAGEFFTSVAGPIDLISTRAPSVDQGIVITRINEQLSHNEFQIALRQLVKDVGDVFQDLHLTHRRYQIETQARDAAKAVWQRMQARSAAGTGEGLAAEAQSEESYYAAEARVEDVLSEIQLTENRLRRLIGQDPGRGYVVQPAAFQSMDADPENWEQSLQIAFAQRPELNETMLTIQSLEMQRSASMSLGKPRLDLVSNFRVNGFGDRPFNDSGRDAPLGPPGTSTPRSDSYYQNLLRAERTGWFAGLQFSIPIDRRLYRSLQHQLEYRLAKARAALKAQKKEISHELWHAFQSSERWSKQVVENERRVKAARQQVSALDAAFPTGQVTVDRLVRAQTTLALAETEYARALTEYNKAHLEVRFRRGTLLEDLKICVQDQS